MRPLLVLALLPVGLLAACSSSTRPPDLTVTGAELTQRTDDGVVILFNVHADNLNPDALPLRDVEYDVALDGHAVFHGSRSAEATVRRFGTQDFKLPAAIRADRVPAGDTIPYTITGRVTYLVPGALAETLFDIDVIRPTTAFHGEGLVTPPVPAAVPTTPSSARPVPPTIPAK